jgi:hypothetical protein
MFFSFCEKCSFSLVRNATFLFSENLPKYLAPIKNFFQKSSRKNLKGFLDGGPGSCGVFRGARGLQR